MSTLFDPDMYRDIQRRLEGLGADAPRQWGKMTPAQMLEHTARALEMALARPPGRQALLGKLIGWMFRSQFLGPKPFARNAPTGPALVVADHPDFARAKARVRALVDELHAGGERGCDGHVHGFFGRLTGKEWGITQYKHLDHHLRQFGA